MFRKCQILSSSLVKFGDLKVFKRLSSSGIPESCSFTVNEITIPYGHGHYVAGKMWKSDPACGAENTTKKISPIICLHGWLDNACSFDRLLPLMMKPNMTVIAIDFPGHGLSSHFDNCTHYDVADGFMSIYRTIKHFGFEKVTLMGHSMGSVMSFIFTGTFPELVDSYIALDIVRPVPANPIAVNRKFTKKIIEIEKKLEQNLPPPSYTYDVIVNKSYLGRDKSISEDGCKILLERGAKKTSDGLYQFTHDLRVVIPTAFGRYTAAESDIFASAIDCNICIIKGDPGTDYEPREEFLKLVEQLKKKRKHNHVEDHFVPGTHHFHLNTPELVAPIINKFLWLPNSSE